MKTETLYGIHPVLEALKAARRNFYEVYTTQPNPSKRLAEVLALAESLKIPVKKVKPSQLQSMIGTDMHQGIGARVSPYPLVELSDMLHQSNLSHDDRYFLLLDNVLDPHNLGALSRTALCVGMNGMIIPKDRSARPTPAVSKASAGALEHVHLAQVNNMATTIKTLKKNGLWIAGLDKRADISIFNSNLAGPMAFVIGGEEKGIRPLVKKQCDLLISIPQKGSLGTLNASVAGAISMYEAFRQRNLNMSP